MKLKRNKSICEYVYYENGKPHLTKRGKEKFGNIDLEKLLERFQTEDFNRTLLR